MANMKIDEQSIQKRIESAEFEAKERLQEAVQSAIKDVQEVKAALRDTPDTMLELFRQSRVALTREVRIDGAEPEGGHYLRAVCMELGGSRYDLICSHSSDAPKAPTGKYRAFFFLVPIKEKA